MNPYQLLDLNLMVLILTTWELLATSYVSDQYRTALICLVPVIDIVPLFPVAMRSHFLTLLGLATVLISSQWFEV